MIFCRLIALLLAMMLLTAGCKADQSAHDNPRALRDYIISLETQVSQNPEAIGPSLNLSLLYGLSVQLDGELSPEERRERANRAITLARKFFDSASSEPQVNVEKVLHIGFILAQNHLSVGSNDLAWAVFDDLDASYGHTPSVSEAINTARKRLVERVHQGYPMDAANPWETGLNFIPSNAAFPQDFSTRPEESRRDTDGGDNADDEKNGE